MEKATFDDIIKLKLRREEAGKKTVELPIKSIGKTLDFTAPSKDIQLDFINNIRSQKDLRGAYDAYKVFVYSCCPALHSSKLHTEIEVVDPYDVVDKLFTPVEVYELGDQLAEAFMGSLDAEIKN